MRRFAAIYMNVHVLGLNVKIMGIVVIVLPITDQDYRIVIQKKRKDNEGTSKHIRIKALNKKYKMLE